MKKSIMPKVKQKKEDPPVPPPDKPWGILFELENIALNARQVEFQVIHALLSEKGIPVTPAIFSRFCVDTSPRQYITNLTASSRKSERNRAKLLSEIEEGLQLSLADGTPKKSVILNAILKAASGNNARLGAVTSLNEEHSSRLIARLELSSRISAIHPYRSGDRCHPSSESWALLARKLSLPFSACTAVATSQKSCHAALAMGMRCVAVPDAFTFFHDFSGADHVMDSVHDQAVIAALKPPEVAS